MQDKTQELLNLANHYERLTEQVDARFQRLDGLFNAPPSEGLQHIVEGLEERKHFPYMLEIVAHGIDVDELLTEPNYEDEDNLARLNLMGLLYEMKVEVLELNLRKIEEAAYEMRKVMHRAQDLLPESARGKEITLRETLQDGTRYEVKFLVNPDYRYPDGFQVNKTSSED